MKWARLPGHGNTIEQACKRFGITPSAYRKARRELGNKTNISSDDELILSGLAGGTPVSMDRLIFYYDWINHAGLSPEDLQAILDRLIAQGLVQRVGELYQLVAEWP